MSSNIDLTGTHHLMCRVCKEPRLTLSCWEQGDDARVFWMPLKCESCGASSLLEVEEIKPGVVSLTVSDMRCDDSEFDPDPYEDYRPNGGGA